MNHHEASPTPSLAAGSNDARSVAQLLDSGCVVEARGLLCDFGYLMDRLKPEALPASGLVAGVVEDWACAIAAAPAPTREERLWESFFREGQHILCRGSEQWPANKILLQLAMEQAEDSPVTAAAERWLEAGGCDWFWLRDLRRPEKAAVGHCLRVLAGHDQPVTGALVCPDGRIASWSADNTLRLWSSQGEALAATPRHPDAIKGCHAFSSGNMLTWTWVELFTWSPQGQLLTRAETGYGLGGMAGALPLPGGRVLSWGGSYLHFWSAQGEKVNYYDYFGNSINISGVLPLPDGRLVLWSDRETHCILLPSFDQGCPSRSKVLDYRFLRRPDGSGTAPNRGLLPLPDGGFVTWEEGRIRLWTAQGEPLATMPGVDVWRVVVLPNGNILSREFWSMKDELSLWSAQGEPLAELRGFETLLLADGRLLFCGYDGADMSLSLWSPTDGQSELLRGPEAHISGALLLSDKRIVTWSWKTLHLLTENVEPLSIMRGHTSGITGALQLPDGRILSWSEDGTLRLWSEQGETQAVARMHVGSVAGVLPLADGSLLSWAEENKLRLWSAEGAPRAVLEGHASEVKGAIQLADGSILSWPRADCSVEDHALRLWSGQGAAASVLEGHTKRINGALQLPDRRLLSWSDDGSLRLWSEQGAPLALLEAGRDEVLGALPLSDGRVLSWGGGYFPRLRLWSAQGAPLASFTGHSHPIVGALELPDGRFLSWQAPRDDGALYLWSATGELLATVDKYIMNLDGVRLLSDGRFLSWSSWPDDRLQLWSAEGQGLAKLKGVKNFVVNAVLFPPGADRAWDKTQDGAPQEHGLQTPREILEALLRSDGALYPWLRIRNGCAIVTEPSSLRLVIAPLEAGASLDWHSPSLPSYHALLENGLMLVSHTDNLAVLRLHHGARPVSLAEAEAEARAKAKAF